MNSLRIRADVVGRSRLNVVSPDQKLTMTGTPDITSYWTLKLALPKSTSLSNVEHCSAPAINFFIGEVFTLDSFKCH